ncbi:hypothetical protein ACFOKI_01220 [Sphingomonas qilianensis]|uniref:Uncharacterized protein n=1 Tax=Sphingomonas qilianensis TaxID=1736690 RepID=A0ABU9XSH3_9SPHN
MEAETINEWPGRDNHGACRPRDTEHWDRLRRDLGVILGLDGPVPDATLKAALADATYADNLLASRRHPALLQRLVAAPPRAGVAPRLSGAALALKATIALRRWAATGFATVDPDRRARRQAACVACPHRVGGTAPELGTCGLCGCPLGRKINMTSEVCPDASSSPGGMTRWGEPAARAM